MNLKLKNIQAWILPLAAVFAVLMSANYSLAKRSVASEKIRELNEIGSRLSEASELVQLGVVRPEFVQEISSQRRDLEQRMSESEKPGVVQGQLVASARSTGLELREVQPIAQQHASLAKSASTFPAYRVSVEGSYRQIAEFMQVCRVQRVPSRVNSFRVSPAVDEQGKPKGRLHAELVMESFIPVMAEMPAVAGSK